MPTADPPPAGAPTPSPGGAGAKTGVAATVRTMAVTAVVVAGTLLLGGYIVHEITRSDHLPTAPVTSVATSNGTAGPAGPGDPGAGNGPDFRFRGRRGEGRFQDPSDGSDPGDFGPPGRSVPPDGTTATTGSA